MAQTSIYHYESNGKGKTKKMHTVPHYAILTTTTRKPVLPQQPNKCKYRISTYYLPSSCIEFIKSSNTACAFTKTNK
jgi:hypothetical protein